MISVVVVVSSCGAGGMSILCPVNGTLPNSIPPLYDLAIIIPVLCAPYVILSYPSALGANIVPYKVPDPLIVNDSALHRLYNICPLLISVLELILSPLTVHPYN